MHEDYRTGVPAQDSLLFFLGGSQFSALFFNLQGKSRGGVLFVCLKILFLSQGQMR